MAWEWKHRVWNAAATPVRAVVWAPAHAAVDLTKTATAYYAKDFWDIAMETANEIQDTISEAGKRWKWYHKAANVWVIAPLWSAAKLITWWIQSVVNPFVNWVFNVAKTWWNFLKNEFNTVKSVLSKNPVSDFSFEKLKLTPTRKSRWHPKNLLIGWATAAVVAAGSPAPASIPPVSLPEAYDKSKWSAAALDKDSQALIASIDAKAEVATNENKELKETIKSMQKQMEEQNKLMAEQNQLMQQQLKQKDDLIASLQANDTKQIAQDAVKNQVEEKLDSDSESPKKKASKKQPVA
jgi:hypothetical protein